MTRSSEPQEQFDSSIAHALAAYRYAIAAVPGESLFVQGQSVFVGRFEFQRASQAFAMIVELGWAFFVRIEAALEAHATRLGFKTPRDVRRLLEAHPDLAEGYNAARELRNTLHHGDGDPTLLRQPARYRHVKPTEGSEPQLLPEHVERFAELFVRVGGILADARRSASATADDI